MKNLKNLLFAVLLILLIGCQTKVPVKQDVLSLHPENPNYFLFKGKPTLLITSGEHYGAIMNADFNFSKYLESIQNAGLNYTRLFMGPYSEMGDNTFGIRNNTMNPKPESWITPWIKDSVSGKYDLSKWNPVFFERLKTFVSMAAEKEIIVEATLFTSFYTNHQWSTSPFNPKNNLQKIDSISFREVNTLQNKQLMNYQEQYVRKIVKELNSFGNLFFEIQNEPWADHPNRVETIAETDTLSHPFAWQRIVETADSTSLKWQKQIASIISNEEIILPNKHLIAKNISNFRNQIENPDPNISIFNFHYAYPVAASANLKLKKVIGLDETGFMPHQDFYYRSQAWKFILSGGALYNNLDYSFTVGSEDGTSVIDQYTPGWGGAAYRMQLKILKDFVEGFDFIHMKPDNSILKVIKGSLTDFQVLAEYGKAYAIYLENGDMAEISLQLPDGEYSAEWVNLISGNTDLTEIVTAKNGTATINCHGFTEDIALKLIKKPN